MPIDSAFDSFFSPIAWVAAQFDSSLNVGATEGWTGAAWLFFIGTIASVVGIGAGAFLAYGVLSGTRSLLNRAFRWSVSGIDVEVAYLNARRYLAISSVLSWAQHRTGAGPSIVEYEPVRLSLDPAKPSRRAAQAVVRAALAIPNVVGSAFAALAMWLRFPVGLYLALGSLWVAFRDQHPHWQSALQGAWEGAMAPSTATAFAVFLAASAVVLDHGLTARLRGRNSYLRSQAAEAEAALAAMSLDCLGTLEDLHRAIQEFTGAWPLTLRSAIEAATDADYTVSAGTVRRADSDAALRLRMALRGVDWASPAPLHGYHEHLGEAEWEPTKALRESLASLMMHTPTGRLFESARHQAPRRARPLLLALSSPSLQPVGASTHDDLPALTWLSRAHLERLGKDIVTQARRHQQRTSRLAPDQRGPQELLAYQQVVDQARSRLHGELWKSLKFAATIEQFQRAVENSHTPRGPLGRLARRFGG